MKLKLALALVLVAATAMAAKEPQDFGCGLKGFTKPYMEPTCQTLDAQVAIQFPDVGAKSCITFTEIPPEYKFIITCYSDIKTKGCENTAFESLTINKKDASVKAKGLTIYDFHVNGGAKLIDVMWIPNGMDLGDYAKGTVAKVSDIIGGNIRGNIKSISCLYYGLETQVNLFCTTPKVLKLTSKLDPATAAQMNYVYLKNDIPVKAKGVNVIEDFE